MHIMRKPNHKRRSATAASCVAASRKQGRRAAVSKHKKDARKLASRQRPSIALLVPLVAPDSGAGHLHPTEKGVLQRKRTILRTIIRNNRNISKNNPGRTANPAPFPGELW